MAYLTFADFREGSVHEAARGLEITSTEASDADLTAAILRLSARIDEWTADHFEPLGTELSPAVLNVTGNGTTRLILPMRATEIVSVTTTAADGTEVEQDVDVWRFHSSLDAAGALRVGVLDWIEVLPGTGLDITPVTNGYVWSRWCWPRHWPVAVEGIFGWTVTPGDIKRALALLVYHHFKPIRQDLRFATRMTTADQQTDFAITEPSGVPEADSIIATYRREMLVGVA